MRRQRFLSPTLRQYERAAHYQPAKYGTEPLSDGFLRLFCEARIDKSANHWYWRGKMTGRKRGGYGEVFIRRDGKVVLQEGAARVIYRLFVGPVPQGQHLGRICGDSQCVRPEHQQPMLRSSIPVLITAARGHAGWQQQQARRKALAQAAKGGQQHT